MSRPTTFRLLRRLLDSHSHREMVFHLQQKRRNHCDDAFRCVESEPEWQRIALPPMKAIADTRFHRIRKCEASHYNTIYTNLLCALENAKRYGHDACIVTFDQSLYTKAREIVAATPEGSYLSKIVIRLGGFHLLSSFFGAFGYIMQGSGIKEVLSLIYAPNSLDKIRTGHAYARAHTLLHLTLATIISKELVIDDDMDANLQNTIEDVKNNTISYNDIENCDKKTEALLYQCIKN
ncbi:hypothetical protein AVEN_121509-1 [Araneus ventricosus]|uniref:Uncharacterized protein n=1 Tax=Araneus ventricosus TaxID=182803 RepID=A0A4Y2R331_ARAVE|nr:hypothetical protein AVEN_121509-1 [Araneus ventricosus]